MSTKSPYWMARRDNQHWRDEEILRSIEWLRAFQGDAEWSARQARAKQNFELGKRAWAEGNQQPLFDPDDMIAWYIFQAHAYALPDQRHDWFEPEAFRIAPIFKRLGQILPSLKRVSGIEGRARDLLNNNGKKQPDDVIYELLVAGAYVRHGWSEVRFIDTTPGRGRTPDLVVEGDKRRWAVECKRVNRSGYEAQERARGDELARPVHKLSRDLGRSVVFEVEFKEELMGIDDDYLASKLQTFVRNGGDGRWDDDISVGKVRNVDWSLAAAVLRHDDVFFGSSRMVELLAGHYRADADHSVAAEWTPAPLRPLHATEMRQASLVSWRSTSLEAKRKKARHFRYLVAKAEEQLPCDMPGVVHVGYEAQDGNSVDAIRHQLNREQVRTFKPEKSELRWVYANYLTPEHTNDPNEAAALSETTAHYRIGQHHKEQPLPSHLLFVDGGGTIGYHWG